MEPTINSLAIDMAALKAEMGAMRSDVRDIKDGINGLMEIRERLGEFSVQGEAVRKEINVMWTRIDATTSANREHHKEDEQKHSAIIAQINRWRGAIQALTIVAAALTAVFGGVTFKLYTDINNMLVEVKVLQSKEK